MKRLLNPMKFMAALALLAFAVGCATMQKEHLLSEAGFKPITPSTPTQQQHLKTLTPGKITSVERGGKTYFVLADPAHNQLYVGSQAEYQKYRQLRLQQKLNEEKIAAEMDKHESKELHWMLAGWD
jgi:hypothetical protein